MNKNDLVSHVAADFSASRNIAEHTITTNFFAISDAPARAEPVGIIRVREVRNLQSRTAPRPQSKDR